MTTVAASNAKTSHKAKKACCTASLHLDIPFGSKRGDSALSVSGCLSSHSHIAHQSRGKRHKESSISGTHGSSKSVRHIDTNTAQCHVNSALQLPTGCEAEALRLRMSGRALQPLMTTSNKPKQQGMSARVSRVDRKVNPRRSGAVSNERRDFTNQIALHGATNGTTAIKMNGRSQQSSKNCQKHAVWYGDTNVLVKSNAEYAPLPPANVTFFNL